ncbi:predicted protein [Postia placenta Mad-698-R]|nr:predicted protein [Postia placenta Mad-698-R]
MSLMEMQLIECAWENLTLYPSIAQLEERETVIGCGAVSRIWLCQHRPSLSQVPQGPNGKDYSHTGAGEHVQAFKEDGKEEYPEDMYCHALMFLLPGCLTLPAIMSDALEAANVDEDVLCRDLLSILARLERLPVLDPNASPPVKIRRMHIENLVKRCSAYSHLSADSSSNPTIPDDPAGLLPCYQELQSSRSRRQIAGFTVQARVAKILPALNLPPLTPSQLSDVISHLPAGNHACVENAALSIFCRGHEESSPAVWEDALSHLAKHVPTIAKIRRQATYTAARTNVHDRLVHRHRVIQRITDSNQGSQLLRLIFKHLEAIHFAKDWNSQSGPGSKLAKTRFNKSVFSQLPHVVDQLGDLTPEEQDRLISGQLQGEYKEWLRRSETIITARNRLLEMYNLFGAGVLLDPVWNVDHLAAHRTPAFPKVFRLLAEHVAPHMEIRHEQASHALLCLVGILGSDDDVAHVREFLHNHFPVNNLYSEVVNSSSRSGGSTYREEMMGPPPPPLLRGGEFTSSGNYDLQQDVSSPSPPLSEMRPGKSTLGAAPKRNLTTAIPDSRSFESTASTSGNMRGGNPHKLPRTAQDDDEVDAIPQCKRLIEAHQGEGPVVKAPGAAGAKAQSMEVPDRGCLILMAKFIAQAHDRDVFIEGMKAGSMAKTVQYNQGKLALDATEAHFRLMETLMRLNDARRKLNMPPLASFPIVPQPYLQDISKVWMAVIYPKVEVLGGAFTEMAAPPAHTSQDEEFSDRDEDNEGRHPLPRSRGA